MLRPVTRSNANGDEGGQGARSRRGRPSLARQRHELIVSQVRRSGSVRVADLAAQLEVSEMTVRRDLDALDDAGLILKVHGGATVRYEHSTDEPGFEVKRSRNPLEKRAIAASAAVLIGPSAAIGITAGTTTALLAAELVRVANLTVVTNSVPVADIFHATPRTDRTVILVGGERTPSDALVGPVSVNALRAFHLDMVFMGVHGMHERAGFTTPNLLEADKVPIETTLPISSMQEIGVVLGTKFVYHRAAPSEIIPQAWDRCVTVTTRGCFSRSFVTARCGRPCPPDLDTHP